MFPSAPLVDRRGFLTAAAATAVAALGARERHASPALRVGFAGARGAAERGARLGGEEAAHAAALFGSDVTLVVDADARHLLGEGRVAALVGGRDDDDAARLAALAAEAGALFFNVGAASDALRSARCAPAAFHVAASETMRRAAREAAGGGTVALWHDSLTQYGAAQLNDRFRARFGLGMDGDAWAAWMAVKVVAEASLRARSAEPAPLAAYLTRPGVRFDGHKGRPLSFGVADHQLRQPLYLVRTEAGGVTSAVELRAPTSDASAAADGTCASARGDA